MPGDATQADGAGQISGKIQTIPPKVSFKTDQVPPAQYIYLQQNDFLSLIVLSSATGGVLSVRYRYLTPEGEIKEGAKTVNLPGNTVPIQIPFLEGWLLSIAAQTNGTPTGSWTFMQVFTGRGAVITQPSTVAGMIWEGYIPGTGVAGWPGTTSQRISDGAGFFRTIVGTTPAAGADISELVPAATRRILLSFSATLTTSAAVANRQVQFKITDLGGHDHYISPVFLNQPAATTQTYSLFNNLQTGAALTPSINVPYPIPLPQGANMFVLSSTLNRQAADQWTAPNYIVLEWGSWDNS